MGMGDEHPWPCGPLDEGGESPRVSVALISMQEFNLESAAEGGCHEPSSEDLTFSGVS